MATGTKTKSATSAKQPTAAKKPASSAQTSSASSAPRTDQPTEARRETNPTQARTKSNASFVDNNVVRNLGTDPIQGGMVTVKGGEHAGRYGIYEDNGEFDEKTGLPEAIVVRTRDERSNERLVVNYDDCVKALPR